MVAGFALVLVAEVVAVNLGARQGVASISLTIFFLTLALGVSIVRPRWIKKDLEDHPNFQREQTLRIDDEGLHWKSEVEQSDPGWNAYSRYQETQNLVLLYLGKRLIQVIPKRALSPAELEELRRLLQARVSGNTTVPELVRKSPSSSSA